MKIRTFSILAGSEACNARCPFCVSKMTPPLGLELKEPQVNWRNFEIACLLAKQSGVTTAMFTGKGEPTLFPDQISKYLDAMKKYEFPLIEIQTNGIPIADHGKYDAYLKYWYQSGMTTVAISVVHYDEKKNHQIYVPYRNSYINLPSLINLLHGHGFSVRLTCIGAAGFIDSRKELENLLDFARQNKVEQLTFTPVNKPDTVLNQEAWDWTNRHHLPKNQINDIISYLQTQGSKLLQLPHGATVYDVGGQNICLNYCLTVQPESEEMRNLIFFPDGHLRYYWQYSGAIII